MPSFPSERLDGHRVAGDRLYIVRIVIVGLTSITSAALMRILVEQVVHGLAPFVLSFPAAIVATLVAGARAGWITLIGCQVLTFAFVMPHWMPHDGDYACSLVTFLLSTISLVATVWATGAYRVSANALQIQCRREVETLALVMKEIDHRTKNNFQIAANLLFAQALSSPEPNVRSELKLAANRMTSMAAIYESLSTQQPDDGKLRLREHLEWACSGIRDSLLPPCIILNVEGDEIEVSSAAALTIALVVNEWITNAIKHAFDQQGGRIDVRVIRRPACVKVEVADNGSGQSDCSRQGIGSRLMTSLVEVLNGHTELVSDRGTLRVLTVPL